MIAGSAFKFRELPPPVAVPAGVTDCGSVNVALPETTFACANTRLPPNVAAVPPAFSDVPSA
jgi:hypothetical protein